MTTPLQAAMLTKIARHEMSELNGAEPDTWDDIKYGVWANCIIESAQDKGVIASLINAGLVEVQQDEDPHDNIVLFTADGFAAYKGL